MGGLSVNTTVEDVKHYFEQFGKVGLPLREEQAWGWQSKHPVTVMAKKGLGLLLW